MRLLVVLFGFLILTGCGPTRRPRATEVSFHTLREYDKSNTAIFVVRFADCAPQSQMRDILGALYFIGYGTDYLVKHPQVPESIRVQKAAGANYYSFPVRSDEETGPLWMRIQVTYRLPNLTEKENIFRVAEKTMEPGKVHRFEFSCEAAKVKMKYVNQTLPEFFKDVPDRSSLRGFLSEMK